MLHSCLFNFRIEFNLSKSLIKPTHLDSPSGHMPLADTSSLLEKVQVRSFLHLHRQNLRLILQSIRAPDMDCMAAVAMPPPGLKVSGFPIDLFFDLTCHAMNCNLRFVSTVAFVLKCFAGKSTFATDRTHLSACMLGKSISRGKGLPTG